MRWDLRGVLREIDFTGEAGAGDCASEVKSIQPWYTAESLANLNLPKDADRNGQASLCKSNMFFHTPCMK